MRLIIDMESRSTVDLKKRGSFVYAEDASTDILCIAYKWKNKSPQIWKRGEPPTEILDAIQSADTIVAHNMSGFEAPMWHYICHKRWGWPPLPAEKLRCSAAKAAMHALPRSLENACKALNLPIKKDIEGNRIMQRMCRPKNKSDNGAPLEWNEHPDDLERLYVYCMNDVIAEEALDTALRDLPDSELKVWQLDMTINTRGIQADLFGARKMQEMVLEHEAILLTRLSTLTNGAVKTAKQIEVLRKYLLGLGVDLPDLAAATVREALKREDLNSEARELLEIRKSLGRSSYAKYQAILDRASKDGRVRGTLLYHGAGTGRWSGVGIQPQNLPSRIKISAPPEEILSAASSGGLSLFNALYEDNPMTAAGATIRSVLTAAPGKDLIVADYAAIEGRGLAWLAGEETELENYRTGLDVYIANASMILHKAYDQITKEERQVPGKISVLACGYGGGANAVRKFGSEDLTDEEIMERIVRPWRDAHPMTTSFWYSLERACLDAVSRPGAVTNCREIAFCVRNKFLMCRLPSGRFLYYYDPLLLPKETPWGEMKNVVTYMTVNGMTKKWERASTFGGKLAENITQAICRDIMAEAMIRIEAAGYPVVLSVHDEIVCEVPMGFGSVEEFVTLMCKVPPWAAGFPISAEGFRTKRYRK